MLRAFVAGKMPKGRHAEVEVGACAACHLSHDPRWPQIGASRGHRIHFEQQQDRLRQVPRRRRARLRAGLDRLRGVPRQAPGRRGRHDPAPLLRLPRVPHHRARAAPDPPRLHALPHRAGDPRPHERPRQRHGDGLRRLPQAARAARPGHAGLHHLPQGDEEGRAAPRAGHQRCVDCHKPHTWKAEAPACLGCHASAPLHAKAQACTTCHAFGGAPLPPRAPSDTPPP